MTIFTENSSHSATPSPIYLSTALRNISHVSFILRGSQVNGSAVAIQFFIVNPLALVAQPLQPHIFPPAHHGRPSHQNRIYLTSKPYPKPKPQPPPAFCPLRFVFPCCAAPYANLPRLSFSTNRTAWHPSSSNVNASTSTTATGPALVGA